jgi:hypothetical protein
MLRAEVKEVAGENGAAFGGGTDKLVFVIQPNCPHFVGADDIVPARPEDTCQLRYEVFV